MKFIGSLILICVVFAGFDYLSKRKMNVDSIKEVIEGCPGAARLTAEVGPFGKTLRGECIIP